MATVLETGLYQNISTGDVGIFSSESPNDVNDVGSAGSSWVWAGIVSLETKEWKHRLRRDKEF